MWILCLRLPSLLIIPDSFSFESSSPLGVIPSVAVLLVLYLAVVDSGVMFEIVVVIQNEFGTNLILP